VNNINLSGKTILRESVRGIIKRENKLLMVYSPKAGDYMFPGGGIDAGETHEEALAREIREECGARLKSICSEFGKTVEYDIPVEPGYDVFKIVCYYYVCNVDPAFGKRSLEEYEANMGIEPVWVDIDRAIEANKAVIDTKKHGAPRWTRRELFVLELLKKEFM